MKTGLKGIIDDVVENAVNSSSAVALLLSSVKLLANELKKVAENVMAINERLNEHEQAIELLCKLQEDKATGVVDYTKVNKTTTKPN